MFESIAETSIFTTSGRFSVGCILAKFDSNTDYSKIYTANPVISHATIGTVGPPKRTHPPAHFGRRGSRWFRNRSTGLPPSARTPFRSPTISLPASTRRLALEDSKYCELYVVSLHARLRASPLSWRMHLHPDGDRSITYALTLVPTGRSSPLNTISFASRVQVDLNACFSRVK